MPALPPKKVIVTGSAGILGRALVREMSGAGFSVRGLSHADLDVADLEAVRAALGRHRPDVVVNCAAYTDVDGCEKEERLAFLVNGIGAKNVALAAAELGASPVHVSTDFVFDGEKGSPYEEFDATRPLSVYGRSKLLGEFLVREAAARFAIVRTQWLFGLGGRNFVDSILKAAAEKGELRVVDDQRGCPTYAPHLARQIRLLVEANARGTYHAAGHGVVSWFEFASRIVAAAGLKTKIVPIASSELKRPARRPAYSALRNLHLDLTLGDEMRPFEEGLDAYVAERATAAAAGRESGS